MKIAYMALAAILALPALAQKTSAGMSAGAAATSRQATSDAEAHVRPVAEPYTWREDFQGPALGQFASYPPVQDVGYDPSLEPTSSYGARGARSLMRILKPVRSGPERF